MNVERALVERMGERVAIGGPGRAGNSNGWVPTVATVSQSPQNAAGATAGPPGGQESRGRGNASKEGNEHRLSERVNG